MAAYKNLSRVERDFRTIKIDDLDLRPIYHYLAARVRAHILICMLAAYVVWHLRKDLAPLTFTDECIPEREDPVSPAPDLRKSLCEMGGRCIALLIFHREEVSRYGTQQKILHHGAPMDEES